MTTDAHPSYLGYVGDAAHMTAYLAYQARYRQQPRESDKVTIEMLTRLVPEPRSELRVLDIGCSTGNFLFHLRRAIPRLALAGLDVSPEAILACKDDPELAGIDFREADILALPPEPRSDCIVANASLMFFDPDEFARALMRIGAAITTGGYFLAFDLFHPFDQDVAVLERTHAHAGELRFHFRSYSTVTAALAKAGLTDACFTPFQMPFDLAPPAGPSDVNTYTTRSAGGERLSFRGVLFQPWCHLLVRKKGA